ncbi:MAG: helix-turn-helix domain-containing protein [Marinilabilia sp.]
MTTQTNPELDLAGEFVRYTNRHVFLTGKAGTGKTTFLHNLKETLPKRMIVVAPTGVAAINAGGVTIHSFFQLPFGPLVPGANGGSSGDERNRHKFSRQKIDIIRTLDLLVIDEVSMVRADLLDGIDEVLRRYRKSSLPFGGVQLLMIGDLQQLAPVIRDEEWSLLRPYYESGFFFGSRALKQTDYVSIELKHIFRQQDETFIRVLNQIRDNRLDHRGLDLLNQCYRPHVLNNDTEGYITLTTHNAQARRINNARLEKLPGSPRKFLAGVEGNFPESNFPTDEELVLKTGAQVMFIKNDPSADKRYYNGKIGKVTGFTRENVLVKCPGDEEAIEVIPDRWENSRYKIDQETKEIKEEIEGTFTQYPLKTAWAITVHKSQGLTFEKAIIDANAAFAHGQVYVALSRCKSLEGLVLTNPLDVSALKTDREVSDFNRRVEENQADKEVLEDSKRAYRLKLLKEMFDQASLERQLAYCLKVVYENRGAVQDELPQAVADMKNFVTSELMPVARKFSGQIEQLIRKDPDLQTNDHLQERIGKACVWFHEKISKGVLQPFGELKTETDNKEVRKTLKKVLERLESEIMVRVYVFDACKDGFSIKKYHEARAKGLLEKSPRHKDMRESSAVAKVSVEHPELYARLKSWRDQRAEELGRPVYMVLQVKSMVSVASTLPMTVKELKKVPGFGRRKLELFGREVIALIHAYCKDKGLDIPSPDEKPFEIPVPEKKKDKPDTKQVTFDLFKKGRNVEQIAEERGLTVSTIYRHVCHFVKKGEVNVFQFIAPDKVEMVTSWLAENEPETLTEAKIHFGEEVSWDELRLITSHQAYLNTDETEKNS